MKGIRKLFLGLILLTLFGVAFKVDAKAADVPADSITIKSVSKPTSWSGTTANATITFEFIASGTSAVFPTTDDNNNEETFEIRKADDTPLGTVTVKFWKRSTGNYIQVGAGAEELVSTNSKSIDVPLSKTTIEGALVDGALQIKAYSAHSTDNTKTDTIRAGKVTFSAEKDGGTLTGITTTPATPLYILKGDSKDISFAPVEKGGYKFSNWKDSSTDNRNPRTVTMGDSDINLVAVYAINPDAVDIPKLNGAAVIANAETSRTYFEVEKNTYGGKITDHLAVTNPVTVNGTPVNYGSTATYFWFTAPNMEATNVPIKITMEDGASFTYSIDVVKTSNIGIKFAQSSYTMGVNTPTTLSLVATGTKPNDGIVYSSSSPSVTVTGQDNTNLTVTVNGSSAVSGVTLTATAKYKDIGGNTFTKTATTLITVQTLKMKDDLFVIKGQKVCLGDFISTGTKDMVVTTLTNNADSYIDLTNGAGSKLSDITVKGKAKTTALDKTKFVVDGNQMKVTVYEAPSMTVETSGLSGSSTGSGTYSYKVTMPWGLYRDDTKYWVPELKKAILIFKSSSDDGKTKEVVLDDLKDDSDKLSKTQTKKIDVKTLTSYLRDICRKDEETVTVWACAVNGEDNNDTEVKTDSKELKVYKISLDTNGNKTSYTVNGDTVYDYFYKIDGVEYTVVAKSSTGKGKVDKANSVNADSATETTGTATIKLGSSGSGVLGEKRIKVAFSGSSADDNTPAGGGSDDYDDVPKTGESKADIWILWSVLFISILGAGFMIWKRFGLVRAIAEADEEVAIAEHEEQIKAAKKEKEDKIKMLKDLRNL